MSEESETPEASDDRFFLSRQPIVAGERRLIGSEVDGLLLLAWRGLRLLLLGAAHGERAAHQQHEPSDPEQALGESTHTAQNSISRLSPVSFWIFSLARETAPGSLPWAKVR